MEVPYIGELPMPEEDAVTDIPTDKYLVHIKLPQKLITISGNGNVIKIDKGVKVLKIDISGNNNEIHAVNYENGFTSEIVDLNITGNNNKCHIRTTGTLVLKGNKNRHSKVATDSIDEEGHVGANTIIKFTQT